MNIQELPKNCKAGVKEGFRFGNPRRLLIWIFLPMVTFSCRRSAPLAPPPAPQNQPISINLIYPQGPTTLSPTTTLQNEFELILSESSGTVLLDTLAPLNTNVSATVEANDSLINVTSVVYDSVSHQYTCITYKGVNPAHWVTATNQDVQLNVPSQAGQAASILYENVPVQGDWYFNAGVYHIALGTGGGATTYSVEYSQSKNTYTYLYDPQAGLYKFYLPVSLSDVVDLSISPMDTAVSSAFVVPPGDHLTYFELDGVMDTTDVSTALWLAYFLNPGLNFGYPPKYVQKYGMKVQGASADGTEGFIYYNYSDSVPSTMPFQNSSSYTLNATKNNNFSVTFNGIKPSYYATAWNTGSIGYYVWENPDSTTLMALPLLTSLHSRMLAGQDLSGLALTNFNYEMALGYYYFGWLNYACDPSQIQTYHMGYESEYFKTL